MSICPNCKSKLSCGCQKRVAKDGTSVCSNCLNSYEAKSGNTPKPIVRQGTLNPGTDPNIKSITITK